MGSKRLKKKDRISDLPDSILHHILSFLSSKQAIRTSVLAKRWRKQWTNLPVLNFDLSGKLSKFSNEHISRICKSMDNTLVLHDCSKVKKFKIRSDWYNFTLDPNYIAKLRFPIRKQVEDLHLDFDFAYQKKNKLPNFFFNNASLIRLNLSSCSLIAKGSVNWGRLKHLYMYCCRFSNRAIQVVVYGSPLLESLEINYCQGFDLLAIASKSLKKLDLDDLKEEFLLEISCPNLVEFHATTRGLIGGHLSSLSDGAIEYVMCGSTLHELLELNSAGDLTHLIIDSNSLKHLVLVNTGVTDEVVISCPNLEDLYLSFLRIETIKLMNMPSSVNATLRYRCDNVYNDGLGRMILEQLHHVKVLNIGCCLIKFLSAWEIRGVSSPSINSKRLTLDCNSNFAENLHGIAYALRTSPELEKLVIHLGGIQCGCITLVSKGNYWDSKGAVFKCLLSHLKIVEVSGLSSKRDEELEHALNFVEYLLKNARVLEKMVIELDNHREDHRPDFVFEVSQKLSSFSRFSQHAIVELC